MIIFRDTQKEKNIGGHLPLFLNEEKFTHNYSSRFLFDLLVKSNIQV